MGKQPAFLFYPGDWTRDLDDQDLILEGAWIRICCRLWWSPIRGQAKKNLTEWSYILRTHPNKTKVILKTLLQKGIATGEYLDNQNITIISRRMVKDSRISELRRDVGKLGGNPGLKKIRENLVNQTPNQKCQSSVSVSVSKKIKTPPTPPKGETDFLKFWAAYPKKTGKLAAQNAWKKNGRPGIDKILEAIEQQRASPQWTRDSGRFIPNPATWLNQGRWDDVLQEVEIERITGKKPIITG